MNCPKVANDLYWKKINKPTGVEYAEPYYLVQVPKDMGSNNVNYTDDRKWTNVRGYGNILVYQETPAFPAVNFTAHPWNI